MCIYIYKKENDLTLKNKKWWLYNIISVIYKQWKKKKIKKENSIEKLISTKDRFW